MLSAPVVLMLLLQLRPIAVWCVPLEAIIDDDGD